MRVRARRRAACAALLLALTLAGTATAHGDGLVFAGTFELAAGETLVRDFALHYHRVVGSIEASGPVRVSVLGPDGQAALPPERGSRIALNHLVRCCDQTWAPHSLIVEADGPVAGTARVHFLHDDVAVMTYGAESGTVTSQLLLLLLWLPILASVRGLRSWRQALPPAAFAFAGAAIGGALLAWWGARRYGGGVVEGFLASFVDLPILPLNPLASRPSLAILLAFLVTWIAAVVGWSRTHPATRGWAPAGAILAAAPIVTAALVTATYGLEWRPWTMAALASSPVLAGLILTGRRPRAAPR